MTSLLILTILVALVFELIVGSHDASNAIATSVSTKVLTPKKAVIMAAIFNMLGALYSTNVAKTISSGLTYDIKSQVVIIAALLSAIIWGLITWYFGLPSSSSHALIGGLLGSAIAYAGLNVVKWEGVIQKVFIPLLTSPILGFIIALVFMNILNKFTTVNNKWFKRLQIFSAMFTAWAHGNNDSQKAMGIITLALVSAGVHTGNSIPTWVIIASALSIALGTSIGGWKIINTMGEKITKLDNRQGFAAETTAATIIESMSILGIPISTTHVVSSAIIGVGISKGKEYIGWKTVTTMMSAWILTIPVCGVIAALIYEILK